MIKLKEAVVVEGKNDRIKLERLVDATIIETQGFRIFKNPELRGMLKEIAEKRGIIILTDSDAAGFAIRNELRGAIDPRYIKNAYISDIRGKERRKQNPSKEGLLGVEGVPDGEIINALKRAGAIPEGNDSGQSETRRITRTDLYGDGLCGTENSAAKRTALMMKLGLPAHLSTNRLIDVLNILMTYDEYKKTAESL